MEEFTALPTPPSAFEKAVSRRGGEPRGEKD